MTAEEIANKWTVRRFKTANDSDGHSDFEFFQLLVEDIKQYGIDCKPFDKPPNTAKELLESIGEKEIHYCVGSPWPNSGEQLCLYMYGSQIHYGTIEDAKSFRKYVERQTGKKEYIYILNSKPFEHE